MNRDVSFYYLDPSILHPTRRLWLLAMFIN
jgi:hypothetical protein